eukprot:14213917-Alexandrium_andersonii.AAC.1
MSLPLYPERARRRQQTRHHRNSDRWACGCSVPVAMVVFEGIDKTAKPACNLERPNGMEFGHALLKSSG